MNFPVLKTGAVAQYPLLRGQRFSTESVRFLDGSRQNFRILASGLRRWTIRLDVLDEQELCALIDFVDAQGSDVFAFTDPETGDTVARCAIPSTQVDAVMTAEIHGQLSIVIEELA
jgi:hypothetical protein